MSIKVFAKKLFFFLMCLFLIPIFAACGSNKNDESNKSDVGNSSIEDKTETKKENLSLVGEWKSVDEKAERIYSKGDVRTRISYHASTCT